MNFPKVPWITAGLGACTLIVWFWPGACSALAFARDAFAGGAWCTAVTGHFTHWTYSHLEWDLLAFVALGGLLESRSRGLMACVVAVSALAISAAVALFATNLTSYRGLSGIDAALFAALVVSTVFDAIGARDWRLLTVSATLMIVFGAKTIVETTLAVPIFVSTDGRFTSVPLAHLVGALAGVFASCIAMWRRSAPGLARINAHHSSDVVAKGGVADGI